MEMQVLEENKRTKKLQNGFICDIIEPLNKQRLTCLAARINNRGKIFLVRSNVDGSLGSRRNPSVA